MMTGVENTKNCIYFLISKPEVCHPSLRILPAISNDLHLSNIKTVIKVRNL